MDIDPDLNLIGGLPDAVKRQIHQHLAKSSAPSALVPDTGTYVATFASVYGIQTGIKACHQTLHHA